LKAIQNAKAPNDVKTICSFVGLCNFFRTHIKDFAAQLFKLTRKDSGYKGGPLPQPAMDAFKNLQKQLISELVMASPCTDRQYALISDTATNTAEGKFYSILFASKQLKSIMKKTTIGTRFKATSTTNLNKMPSAKIILL